MKQIMPLPDEAIVLVKDIASDLYCDDGDYGAFFIGIDDRGEMTLCTVWADGGVDVLDSERVRVIRRYFCPSCGNRLSVHPMKANDMPNYFCEICGWKGDDGGDGQTYTA